MKKNRLLSFLLSFILLAIICLGLTGCCSHEWIKSSVVEASCLTSGSQTYICSKCGAQKVEIIPCIGTHSWVVVDQEEASCVKTGSVTNQCSVCHEINTTIVPKIDHTIIEAIENRVEPSYASNGSYDVVQRCSVCQTELSRETLIIKNDRLIFENAYSNMWDTNYSASFEILFTYSGSGTTNTLSISGTASCKSDIYSGDGTISVTASGLFSFPFDYVYPFYSESNPDFPLLQLKGTQTNAIYLPVNIIQPGDGILKMVPESAFQTMTLSGNKYSFTLTEDEYLTVYSYLMAFMKQYAASLNKDISNITYSPVAVEYTVTENKISEMNIIADGSAKNTTVKIVMNIKY